MFSTTKCYKCDKYPLQRTLYNYFVVDHHDIGELYCHPHRQTGKNVFATELSGHLLQLLDGAVNF